MYPESEPCDRRTSPFESAAQVAPRVNYFQSAAEYSPSAPPAEEEPRLAGAPSASEASAPRKKNARVFSALFVANGALTCVNCLTLLICSAATFDASRDGVPLPPSAKVCAASAVLGVVFDAVPQMLLAFTVFEGIDGSARMARVVRAYALLAACVYAVFAVALTCAIVALVQSDGLNGFMLSCALSICFCKILFLPTSALVLACLSHGRDARLCPSVLWLTFPHNRERDVEATEFLTVGQFAGR